MELLTDAQRRAIRSAMVEAIHTGLREHRGPIQAIDAHLPPPRNIDAGAALVVDIGGTNMRAAVVEVTEDRSTIVAGPVSARLDLREHEATREEFFDRQARLALSLDPPSALPIGYCFSYPTQILPSLDATLLRWTKGIEINGVVGTRVGEGLHHAFEQRGYEAPSVHVLNDTVASLLGGALGDRHPERVIGLIAGTGSNMAAFFDVGREEPAAINLESGNFDPLHLSDADRRVDEESTNVGAQRFEKAVGGFYLPYVYRAAGGSIDVELGSQELVRRRDEENDKLAALILERAARLVATGLAAVAEAQGGEDPIVVLAEGSLFWGDPKFSTTVEDELAKMLGARAFAVRRREDANLIGSAVAARVQRTVR